MKMKGYKNICNNVNVLYFIFLISILNILWFLNYNKRCILIFLSCCLAIYIINKNMIIVLGISLIIVDSLYLFNLVKKEGFLGDNQDENYENDASNNLLNNDEDDENDASNNLLNNKSKDKNESFTNTISSISDEESDEETNYMHDKSIMKKMKQLNPIILETLKNMNSVHIKELNESINNLTDKIDP